MAVTVQNVRDYDRGFADPDRFPSALIQQYLDQFFTFIKASRLPAVLSAGQVYSVRDTAQLLWTCHQLTAQADGAAGKSGPVTDQKVGDVGVSYANTNVIFRAPDYNLTTYGTNFLRLVRPYSVYAATVG